MHLPLHVILSFLFILLGIIESIWGLGQLYGVVLSRQGQFLLTGSFYNPGPYSGFLATIFPIAFYEWLSRRKEPKSIAGNVAWAAMWLIGCLIPCGMSRTAWLAVSVGTSYVVLMHESKRIGGVLLREPERPIRENDASCRFKVLLPGMPTFATLFIYNVCGNDIIGHNRMCNMIYNIKYIENRWQRSATPADAVRSEIVSSSNSSATFRKSCTTFGRRNYL